MSADAPDSRQRFGLRLAGVNLLTPIDRPAQFIALAAIYPLPLAPRRVRGLTQVHGHPVTVLDAAAAAPTLLPVLQRHAVLVIGDPAEAPMAFLVDEAPRAILIGDGRVAQRPRPPSIDECAFAEVLGEPCFEQDDDEGQAWWQADFHQLFELLIRDGEGGGESGQGQHDLSAAPAPVPGGDVGTERQAGEEGDAGGGEDSSWGGLGSLDGKGNDDERDVGLAAKARSAGPTRADRPGSVARSGGGQAAGRRREGRRGRKREVDGE